METSLRVVKYTLKCGQSKFGLLRGLYHRKIRHKFGSKFYFRWKVYTGRPVLYMFIEHF